MELLLESIIFSNKKYKRKKVTKVYQKNCSRQKTNKQPDSNFKKNGGKQKGGVKLSINRTWNLK